MPNTERRKDYNKLGQAVIDIAVLKEKFESIENNLDRGFKSTEELIWSIKNDFKTMYIELKSEFKEHEEKDEISRNDVLDIKNKLKNVKYIAIAIGITGVAFTKGLDKALAILIGS